MGVAKKSFSYLELVSLAALLYLSQLAASCRSFASPGPPKESQAGKGKAGATLRGQPPVAHMFG